MSCCAHADQGHKLKHTQIQIERDYDRSVPPVLSAAPMPQR
jgi:hypothetical protein